MTINPRPILVTGATGQQGGAVVTHLLRGGQRVRAMVRDESAEKAVALQDKGVELVVGSFDDRDSIAQAVSGVQGLFIVTPAESNADREINWGRNLIEAAKSAEVDHVVFASVMGSAQNTGVPGWDCKGTIEQILAASGLSFTVLRPVRFMENHELDDPMGGVIDNNLIFFFAAESPLQLVTVDDIGGVTATIFADPTSYDGKYIELAGDQLTSTEVVELLSEALGCPVTYQQWRPGLIPGMAEEVEGAFVSTVERLQALDDQGELWRADLAQLRQIYPELTSFATWLKRGGAKRIAAKVLCATIQLHY